MRTAVLGGLVGAVLVIALGMVTTGPNPVLAQRSPGAQPAPAGDLLAFATPLGDQHQQFVVIDPKTRVMSVYHIERASGEIALKSVRQIEWDLQLAEFNGVSPKPREIRLLLEQR